MVGSVVSVEDESIVIDFFMFDVMILPSALNCANSPASEPVLSICSAVRTLGGVYVIVCSPFDLGEILSPPPPVGGLFVGLIFTSPNCAPSIVPNLVLIRMLIAA